MNKQTSFFKTVMRILFGLVCMFGILWIYKYAIYPKLNFKYSEVIETLFCFVVLYCIGFPILYLIIRNMPVELVEKKRTLGIKATIEIIIVESGIGILATTIVIILINVMGLDIDYTKSISTDILTLFKLLVMNPILEELVFRKVILERLRPFGNVKSILISSIMFALPHTVSQGLPQVFTVFVLGFAWAYVVNKTGNIKYSIGLHSFSNLWLGVLPSIMMKTAIGLKIFALVWEIAIPIAAIVILIKRRKLVFAK